MIQTFIEWKGKKYWCNLRLPVDISIPLHSGSGNPNAFGIPFPEFSPLKADGFIGSVAQGGSVNCENLLINPHGNGTHTECAGHISKERITIHQCLKQFFFVVKVISVTPVKNCITLASVKEQLNEISEAILIRTLPNYVSKLTNNYSGNNPAYFEPALCTYLALNGVKHLLTDLPSVDPEHDEGKLAAHHEFWQYPHNTRMDATITEMVFVDDQLEDGLYLLNLQIASIESDASPSKPVLFKLMHAV